MNDLWALINLPGTVRSEWEILFEAMNKFFFFFRERMTNKKTQVYRKFYFLFVRSNTPTQLRYILYMYICTLCALSVEMNISEHLQNYKPTPLQSGWNVRAEMGYIYTCIMQCGWPHGVLHIRSCEDLLTSYIDYIL